MRDKNDYISGEKKRERERKEKKQIISKRNLYKQVSEKKMIEGKGEKKKLNKLKQFNRGA